LNAVLVSPWAFWINIALIKSIVSRIGINYAANGPVLGRNFRLNSAPRTAVFCDHDLALNIDATLRQHIVISGNTVIDENERRGYVAVDRVRVVRRKLFILLRGCRILFQRRLIQL